MNIDWICLKCGMVHMFSTGICGRCGWDRPMKEETKEEREERWRAEIKENRKNNGTLPKGF